MQKTKIYIKLCIILIASIFYFTGFNFAYAEVSEKDLGDYLNQERAAHNLNTLNFDFDLYHAAQSKAQDMINNNYFEHYSPSGKSPWDFIHQTGYDYKIAGENLAMDFTSSKAIHDAWMNSYSHKDNILNSKFENYAIAKLSGNINNKNTIVVVEMFGTKDTSINGKINGLFTSVANYLLGYQQLFK